MGITNPSRYQQEIFRVYNTTNKNIFISAGPGSGKTTTVIELVNQTAPYKKVWMSAFNKSISEELKLRVKPNVDVSTLHSKGMSILRSYTKSSMLELKEIKTWIFGKRLFYDFLKKKFDSERKVSSYLFTLSRLYDLYRMNLVGLTKEDLFGLSSIYNVSVDEEILENTIQLITNIEGYNNEQHERFMIDYTDMLWLPYKFLKRLDYPKYDVVFIDEVQDVNPLQKNLIDNILSDSGRFVAVGDERQAIYSFMGSNLNSLNAFKNSPNTVTLPLSVSYRCSKGIINEANKIFSGLEPTENASEGIIRYGDLEGVMPGDFIICRNNLPLIEKYIDLLSLGKKAYILGKDFGKSLVELVSSINTISDLDIILEDKKNTLKGLGVNNVTNHPSYVDLLEKVQIINNLYLRLKNLDKVKNMLNGMFIEGNEVGKGSFIVLSTIHKAKGLEADRVFILNPSLIPSKYATTELEFYQEKCLMYVAITRARKELVFVEENGVLV